MSRLTYSGQVVRQNAAAHYPRFVPVAGVDPSHLKPSDGEDIFTPEYGDGKMPEHAVDVWQGVEVSPQTGTPPEPISHWTRLRNPLPMNVPSAVGATEVTGRMVDNHSIVRYDADLYPQYKHAGETISIEYISGREPWTAGETGGSAGYLLNGTNAYDQTNEPNPDVYQGESNVGRYRLGMNIHQFASYDQNGKYGQEEMVRAYSGLTPAFPVTKPRLDDYAPYTAPSSGTDTWIQNPFQAVSNFALPSETSMSDSELAGSGFSDEGRM